ncbi:MAG: Lrp/AsnC family transcriptional regulator [Nanoarchaeales archaeon]|nr:Lrp/AsnC family transcriptional regulator [Nanoarchaeales archaeon]
MDKIDKKILNILSQNCRIPDNDIAKSLNLSKDTIKYRINNLKNQNIYTQALLFFDTRVLGYINYQILIQLKSNITNKEEIIEKIKKHDKILWANTFIGKYELQLIVQIKSPHELNKIKDELFELCNHEVQSYSTLTRIYELEFNSINPEIDIDTKIEKKSNYSFSKELTNKSYPNLEEYKEYKISKTEIEILNILSDNPQESLITIADKLNIDRRTVKDKILNLIENKVITHFGINIDTTKFDYITYTLMIKLKTQSPHNALQKPFQELNNIFYAAVFEGEYNLLIYLNAKSPKELNDTINHIKKEIGEYIISTELSIMGEVLSWKQFTRGIYKELLESVK